MEIDMAEKVIAWDNNIEEELAASLIENVEKNYGDMLELPHHVSKKHPPMSREDRAAQFSSFAALTGHKEAIEETVRWTDERIDLDEDSRNALDETFAKVRECIAEHPLVTVTYFQPDERKAGGQYVTVRGQAERFREASQMLVLEGGTEIPLREMVSLVIG